MSCNLEAQYGKNITLSYVFSNKPDYIGNTPLSVTISEIENAPFAADVGAFIIETYIRVDNDFYL